MDGLPIPPIAASLAGISLAARQQDEQAQRRLQRARTERRVEPPTKVEQVDDRPQRERGDPSQRQPKRDKPDTDEHVDLTA